jgi:hypothetical protein
MPVMADTINARVDTRLLDEARKALELGEDVVAVAIIRKALIKAIGDDAMSHEVKLGRPFKNHSS